MDFKVGDEVNVAAKNYGVSIGVARMSTNLEDYPLRTKGIIRHITGRLDLQQTPYLVEVFIPDLHSSTFIPNDAYLRNYPEVGCVLGKVYLWANQNVLFLIGERVQTIVSCKNCPTTSEYAEPNQPDGSFICYSCRRWSHAIQNR